MQKTSVIVSLCLIVLITILFFFLSRALQKEQMAERDRTDRFLNLSVALAVNSIQDDVSFAYRELSELFKDKRTDGSLDEGAILEIIDENPLSGRFADQMLSESTIISYEAEMRENFRVFSSSVTNYPLRIYLEKLKPGEFHEMIFVDNFSGFLVFPLTGKEEEGSIKFLFYQLELKDVVEEYLPELVMSFMANSPDLKRGDLSAFSTEVVTGTRLNRDQLSSGNDLIIDLNRLFNMNTVLDYHKARQERDYIHFEDISNIVDNHLYLVMRHESGSIEEYYRRKIAFYYLGLVLLYLFTVSGILSLLYTTFRVKRSVMREKEFTAMISHELKTPLSVIKLGADNLAGGFVGDSEAVIEYGEMIRKETDRLGNMIGKILSITGTLDADHLSRFTAVSIKTIGNDLKEQSLTLLERHSVDLVLEIDSGRDTLFCNKTTMEGALFNILQNSILYGASLADEKKVYLSFRDEKQKGRDGLLIEIRDSGPGISWKDAQKIFKPFYRGAVGKDNQIAGTGLGLSISRKIIRQHKGQISLKGSLRKETVFQVWIPNRIRNEKNIDD